MKYSVFEGGGLVEYESTVTDFLRKIPRLLSRKDKLLPPESVIREFLVAGNANSGMSGIYSWEPYLCSDKELTLICADLEAAGFRAFDGPPWVRTREDWRIWKFEYLHGIPSVMHRKLSDEVASAVVAYKNANAEDIESCRCNKIRAELALAEFLNSGMKKGH